MADDKPKGRRPTAKEWAIVRKARTQAVEQARRARDLLPAVERFLLVASGDRRGLKPEVDRAITLFQHHFKSSRGGDVREVLDGFTMIAKALDALTRKSFVVVTNDVADRDGKRDGDADPEVLAFVFGREATVYLADRFFFGHLAESAAEKARPAAGLEVRKSYEIPWLGRVLVHETAHFKLGAGHRRGRAFKMETGTCAAGLPVRDFSDAREEAYCYDLYAYCVTTTE